MTEKTREWLVQAVARHERALVRYAASITRDVEAARDVAQEAFLRLARAGPEKVDGHLREWLFTVTRRRALDVKRKEGRMRPLTEPNARTRPEPAGGPDPAQTAQAREAQGQLALALAALPGDQQEVLRLKFQEGMSYREIGRVTARTVGSVGHLIHVGLKALRVRLQ